MSGTARTVSLTTLNALSVADLSQHLGNVYEHAPWVAAAAAAARPFATTVALHQAMSAAIHQASEAERLAFVRGHPDLAGKAARTGALTADSTGEQASAGLDQLGEAEFAAFHRLNDAYRAKFGFPFIICVRRHTRASILASFEKRLAHAPATELATALDEIDRIAALRLDALVTGEGRLNLAGRLSTHVLDTLAGRSAAGLAIELRELSASGGDRLVARAVTNEDGRTDAPLIAGRPVPIGRYELAFAVGDYFADRGVRVADPPFLDIVPIRFSVAEAEGRYHVPLLITPWSYSTYRGS
ncbi:MAG: 2-oxo-4-hydroxy-4-carboxy-5-ureidoimidazoline decarboxylase [Proteobacteria bacterium]|nr:2-oxo-4-hydroxy-4-carboxy-5-ureidoimidazoline decarboxylase [Pseudomonadota bacterium]MBI3499464.1 2-oxo-4-hydroxy-4-carboxy-5-ureidoimidazoline decarboxylase [Pseudomonadota bacterium]